MKQLLFFLLLMLVSGCVLGQVPPPVARNPWSTNLPPRPVLGNDNLSVTNVGSGTNWDFFGIRPSTVARLSDVTASASGIIVQGGAGNNNTFTNPTVIGLLLGSTGNFTGPFYVNLASLTNATAVNQFRMGDWVIQTNSDSSLVISNGNLGYTFVNYSPVGSFALQGAPGPLETITPDVNIYGQLWVQGPQTNSANIYAAGDIFSRGNIAMRSTGGAAKFTVQTNSGNTAIAGTLSTTGAVTFLNGSYTAGSTANTNGVFISTNGLTVSNVAGRIVMGTVSNTAFADSVLGAQFYNLTDYDNWIRLRSGLTADQRNYFSFEDFNGTYKWLVGRNALNHFVVYDAADGNHRFAAAAAGSTYVNAPGAFPVLINGSFLGETFSGTGGLVVQSGGATPTNVASMTPNGGTNNVLQVFNAPVFLDNTYLGIGTNNPSTRIHIIIAGAKVRIQDTGSGSSAIDGTSSGLELISGAMNSGAQTYASALKFMSADPDLTTQNPKFIAGIGARATETYSGNTSGGAALDFVTVPNAPGTTATPFVRMTVGQSGSVGIGTNVPQSALHVAANNANSYIVQFGTTNKPQELLIDTNGVLYGNGSGLTNLGLANNTAFQPASDVTSNLVGLASTVFTNVPLGGTNISVRTAGGTNFFDTTGELNNWAKFSTNALASVVAGSFGSGQMGTGVVTTAASVGPNKFTNFSALSASGSIGTSTNTWIITTNPGSYRVSFGAFINSGNADTVSLQLWTNSAGGTPAHYTNVSLTTTMGTPAVGDTGFKETVITTYGETHFFLQSTNSTASAQTLRNVCLVVAPVTALTNTISMVAPAIVTNSIWVPAGAMVPKLTTTPLASSFSNATVMIDTLDYDDSATEDAWFAYQPGDAFAGDLKCSLYWFTTNTISLSSASNVVWQIGVSALKKGDAPGTFSYSTNYTNTVVFGSNTLQVAKFSLITVTNLSPDLYLNIRVSRIGGDAVDTLAGDAKLSGVRVFTTRTNWVGGYP